MKMKLGMRIKFAIWNMAIRTLMRILYTMTVAEKRKLPIYTDRARLFSVYINEIVKHMYWLCGENPIYIYITVQIRSGRIYPSVWPPTVRLDPEVEVSLARKTAKMVFDGHIRFVEEMAQRN